MKKRTISFLLMLFVLLSSISTGTGFGMQTAYAQSDYLPVPDGWSIAMGDEQSGHGNTGDVFFDNIKVMQVSTEEEPPGNHIPDAGFESGNLDGWTLSGGAEEKFSVISDDTVSGEYALKINGTKSYTNISQIIEVTPNTQYKLTAYGKNTASRHEIQVKNHLNTVIKKIQVANTNGAWQEYSIIFDSGEGTFITLMIQDFVIATGYIDALSLVEVVPTTEIVLNKSSLTLYGVGLTEQLEATVLPEGAQQDVTWSSDNEAVATVSETGLVTAVSLGSASIVATSKTDGEISAACSVSVQNIPITGVVLNKNEINLNSTHMSEQLTAQVHPEVAIQTVTWSSADTNIATVGDDGLVTGISQGTTTVLATSVSDPEYFAECTVNVVLESVSEVVLNNTEITLESPGATAQLVAAVTPPEAVQAVSWQSFNEKVAIVSETGLVTAVGPGETVIRAVSQGDSDYYSDCEVTVTGLALNEYLKLLSEGDTFQLEAAVFPSSSSQEVVWVSSDEEVAVVSYEGLVTAMGEGVATITATSVAEPSFSTGCKIAVAAIYEDFSKDAAQFTIREIIPGGTWTAADGKYVLALTSTATSSIQGNISTHATQLMQNLNITSKINIVGTGGVWNDGGLVFHYTDSSNYYFVNICESNDTGVHGIFKVQNGKVSELLDFGNDTVITSDTDYLLRVIREGNTISVQLNGNDMGSVKDATFHAGYVGFATKNDSAIFDDLIVQGTILNDTENPTVPTGLSGNSNRFYRVKLSWTPSTDNIGVSGYAVYRDSELMGTSGSTEYTDNTVTAGETYEYTIKAYDFAGNYSEESAATQVTTSDEIFGDEAKLTWMPPVLENPVTIHVSNANKALQLEAGKDYIIEFDEKISTARGLIIHGNGARNIVMIGGEIDIPWAGTYEHNEAWAQQRRAMYITNWSGTLHIEGLWIHGEDLAEGINFATSYAGSILQVQNLRADGIHGRPEEHAVNFLGVAHPDILQNWGGPSYYRVDKLTGSTDYQGFMVQPSQYGTKTILADWRRIDITKTFKAGFGIYRSPSTPQSAHTEKINIHEVFIKPMEEGGMVYYPQTDPELAAVENIAYPPGHFVSAGTTGGIGIAGMNYVSPGYIEDEEAPETPAELTGTLSVDEGKANLSWTPSMDNVGIQAYEVYRNNVLTGSTNLPEYVDTGLLPGNVYTYTVIAVDSSGNKSMESASLTLTMPGGSTGEPGGDEDGDDSTPGGGPGNTPQPGLQTDKTVVKVNAQELSDAFDKAQTDAAGIKTAVITAPEVEGAAAYTLVLPTSEVTDSKVEKRVEFITAIARMTIPSNMLAKANITQEEVEFSIGRVESTELPDDLLAQIGGRPVIELGAIVDGERIEYNNPDAPVTISIPYVPTEDELKNSGNIIVWYVDGNGKAHVVKTGRYNAATGRVIFEVTHFSKYAVTNASKTFDDLQGAWGKKEIEYLAVREIIHGTVSTEYLPKEMITRADFAKLILSVINKQAEITGSFTDVKAVDYFYKDVMMASALGIVNGIGDGRFAPRERITRQEMMVMIERALKVANAELTETADYSAYDDAAQVAGYAKSSVAKLIASGIIQGSNNRLRPADSLTREEAARVIYLVYHMMYK